MRIAALEVRDFKRIREIKINPPADRELLLIGGNNANGKTSLLDALSAAFGGKANVPADPVRHGADEAEIVVRLDSGITVRRTISPDGTTRLEVRDDLGAVKAPQQVLDRLIAGGHFLDPLAFLSCKPADQRAELLMLIDQDGKIAELDARRERVFGRRTEVGRDLKRALAQLESTPGASPGEPIDVVALSNEAGELANIQRAGDGLGATVKHAEMVLANATADVVAIDNRIDALVVELAQLRASRGDSVQAKAVAKDGVEAARAKLEKAIGEWPAHARRRDEINAELARAQAHNRKVAEDGAAAASRLRLAEQVGKLDAEVKELSGVIEAIDALKHAALDGAKLPVPGLGVSADAVMLNDVPLEQASAAERWRVAVALAIAANPQLRDVWIRDGALLDDDSLAALAALAREHGCRVWLERVGSRDPGAIVIEDGKVRETAVVDVNQGSLFQ